MLPKLDFNVVDFETTRYKRTHNTSVAETEDLLKMCYGDKCWRVILCNSGQEALNTVISLIQPKTVIVDDETYFELRFNLQYHEKWIGYKYIQLKDLDNTEDLKNALEKAEKPLLVCGDHPTTFGNWKDVKTISDLVHQFGGYVMMDNSIVSLYYSNPLNLGADILVESYTKYVTGQGDTFAGGIALADSMKWLDDKPVPAEVPGMKTVMWVTSRRGNVVYPLIAYNVAKGLETLDVRMMLHSDNAQNIYFLLKHCGFDVRYCGLGGLLTLFGIKPDFCKHFNHLVTCGTFGCAYSNADFFRSDTYYTAGICTRLSVGLEEFPLIAKDILQALSYSEDKGAAYLVYLKIKDLFAIMVDNLNSKPFQLDENITGVSESFRSHFTYNVFHYSHASKKADIHFKEGG